MSLKQFIKSKLFFKHLSLIVLSFFVLLFLVMQLLKIYTRHGKEYEVPKIVDLMLQDVVNSSELSNFEVVVLDSVYKENMRSGTIISQDPNPGSIVKKGRKIYVTIAASSGEIVEMPGCINVSLKTAVQNLMERNLKVGTLMFRSSDMTGDGFVVEQRFRGQSIRTGAEIPSGEIIDLIVEVSSTTNSVKVPNIIGKSEKEAEMLLWQAGLNVGFKQYDGQEYNDKMRVVSYSPLVDRATIGTNISINFMDSSKKKYSDQVNRFESQRKKTQESEQINDAIEQQINIEEENTQETE